MPKLAEQREGAQHLAPYEHHGMVFGAPDARGNVHAPCPVCGREDGKFSVNVRNGKAGCFVCREGSPKGGMNQWWFIRKLHELSLARGGDCEALAAHRNLLSADTPAAWGCCRSAMTNDWLVPAWQHPGGELMQLYTYSADGRGKPTLYPTPGMQNAAGAGGACMFGINLYDRGKPDVFLCYSDDTEILTSRGWVLFKDLTDDAEVAAYNKDDESVTFERPLARQEFQYDGGMVPLRADWCDLLVTPEHRVLWRYGGKRGDGVKVRSADALPSMFKLPSAGTKWGGKEAVTTTEARLLTAFTADGCIRRGFQLEFSLYKDRKKNRLKELLTAAGVPFKVMQSPGQVAKNAESIIVDRRDAPFFLANCPNKDWTIDVLSWSLEARRAILDELKFWDGDSTEGTSRLYTSKHDQADILSALAAMSGYSCFVRVKKSTNPKWSDEITLHLADKTWKSCRPPGEARVPYSDKVYCVTTSTGFVVVRRNGCTTVSGNCEGPWDAMALWELLRCARRADDGGVEFTGDPDASLAASANVLAIPGCGAVGEPFRRWAGTFAGKRLFLLFDSDHPKVVCKKCRGKPYSTVEHAACPRCGGRETAGKAVVAGLERGLMPAVAILGALPAADQPSEVHHLHWGDAGYDPELPSGYDVRDLLTKGLPAAVDARLPRLGRLLGMLRPVPASLVAGGSTARPGAVNPDLLPCETWHDCVNACRKAMKWPAPGEEHDKGLSFMLAIAASTMSVGIQLWGTCVSQASSGKTELAMALAPDKEHVVCISDFTGLHSGYKSDKEGTEDHSLMAKLHGKLLIVKEANLLLQKPNLMELLGQLRDAYDTMTDVHYKHGVVRNYAGHRFTVLLCGTELLKALDQTDLGERTLCCRIVDDMDPVLEREITLRKIRQQAREMSIRADGTFESRAGPETVTMQRTVAGYLQHLMTNAQRLLDQLEPAPDAEERLADYAEFVAFMRARPSSRHRETAERELSFRLGQQFVRLASCLAIVLNRGSMCDPDVMKRVHGVTMDTARGRSFELCRRLHVVGEGGMDGRALAIQTGKEYKLERGGEASEYRLLCFLRDIKAVKPFPSPDQPGATFWRLTPRLRRLFDAVVGEVEE